MKKFLASLLLMVFILPMTLQAQEVGSKFFYDFNDKSIEEWKLVDRDNDGKNWSVSDEGYIYSESTADVKPNNIIATADKYAIYATSKITFDVRPETDKGIEKYGVGVVYSLDGESFMTLQDETALASATGWNTIEISLEYIAGKEVYIGILHNTYDDQGTILVDNVRLTDGKLPTAENVVAEKNENNVDVTWDVPTEGFTNFNLTGYRVYRSNGDVQDAEMIANDLTETSYTDNTWADAEQGVYKYGVAALYLGTSAKRNTETLLEENFETTEYSNVPEGWTTFSDPATANSLGNWMTSTEGIGIYGPFKGEKSAYSIGYLEQGGNYYLVTPAIDFTTSMNPTLDFYYISPSWMGTSSSITVSYSESATGPWTELWKHEGVGADEWGAANVNLMELSGKVAYIAFIATDNMAFGAGIDDITITATVADTPVPVASEIVWSNTVDKDMTTIASINVTADNNASVEGATITLANVNEAEYKYEETLDATGKAQIEVRKGTYKVNVSLEGYYEYEETAEILKETTINCTLEAKPEVVEGLYVSPTAWAMWDYEAASYNVKLNGELVAENITEKYYQHNTTSLVEGEEYTTVVEPEGLQGSVLEYTWTYKACYNFADAKNFSAKEQDGKAMLSWTMPEYEVESDPIYEFSVNFDNGSLIDWTTIDADGDGRNWQNTSEFANQGFGIENTFCAASISYDNEIGAITPDNYLVFNQKCAITTGSKLRFSVAAQSKDAANEHYGVYVSTKSKTNAIDYVLVYEETLTAGEVAADMTQGAWFEKEIDLGDYAGQNVYVAFRHFNSADNFWIKLDNVSLTNTARGIAEEEGEWLFYDNGIYESASGNFDASTMQPSQIYWAIMFPADMISDYAGKTISKVSMYDNSAHRGAFSIHKGGDTAPGTMVHLQTYETSGIKDFVEFELETPIVINGNENIWIQFSNEYGSGDYPAAYSADMGDPNSRWQSSDGSLWFDSNWFGPGWYGTWMIRAFVNGEGAPTPPAPDVTTVEPIGTMVYRNGELITPEPIKETTFTDDLIEGETEVEYSVRIVYGGEKDNSYYAMSCPVATELKLYQPMNCYKPEKLYGEATLKDDGTFGATLVWPYVKEWLYYDDSEVTSAVGGGGTIYWGIMFPAEDLAPYIGSSMTKVALYDFEAGDATLSISYGGDKAPATTVHSQNFVFEGSQEFFELDLTSPIPITNENVWITLYQSGAEYPAAVTDYTGDPNGRWVSIDGNGWYDLISLNSELDFTWFLRVYASNEAKGGQVYEIEKLQGNVGVELNATSLDKPKSIASSRNGDEEILDHYNIYRSTTNGNYELIEETTDNKFFDEIEKGTYYYQVTAVYTRGDEECESDPATAYEDQSKDYVVIEVTAINENGVVGTMVYPNPTDGNLNINAENMRRITIVNALGQMVYDREVNSDETIINMSQFDAGIYLVRITTDNGVAVKRVSVL